MKRPGKEKDQANQRTELLDQAARHLRGNKLEPALKLYEQLYEQEPEDWTVANSLGDLYVRLRKQDEAIAVFMHLAEHMAEQGHAVKARALYRKVLRMRPGDTAATSRVAELENEHLDASPFMQRVRGVLLDAQSAVASAPVEEPQAAEDAPLRLSSPSVPLRVSTFASAPEPVPSFQPEPEPPPPVYQPEPVFVPPAQAAVFVPSPAPSPAFDYSDTRETDVSFDGYAQPAAPVAPYIHAAPQAAIDTASVSVPVAEPGAPGAFSPSPDDWIPLGRMLAAAALQDGPASPEDMTRDAAFQRIETSARRAAAGGDFRSARDVVEQFLLGYTEDVDALQLLVELSIYAGFDDVASSQVRLAHALLAARRLSSSRYVVLDLLQRYPGDPLVVDLAEHLVAAGSAAAPRAAASSAAAVADDAVEQLFDDDGLVTEDRAEEAQARGADPFAEWLGAADESEARTALAAASRMASMGNDTAAVGALEPLMRTPALRPVAGVALAQLYRREGNLAKALHCLEQALEQPPVNADNAHALAYELALTLEAMGQRHEALGLYRELLSEVGPAFRDVAARAEQLSAA